MTLLDEMISAFHGFIAIITGKRDAEKHFNLTLYGLSGAAIALVISFAISTFVPSIIGDSSSTLSAPQALSFTAGVFVIQVGAAAIVLNQLNRLDGFVPYLVVDFYSTLFITILAIIPSLLKIQSPMFVIILAQILGIDFIPPPSPQ